MRRYYPPLAPMERKIFQCLEKSKGLQSSDLKSTI